MNNIDPGTEWRRLAETYSQMSEEELQVVADEAYELTDIARDVLQSEIRNRGLSIALREAPSSEEELEPEPLVDADADSDAEFEEEEFDPRELDLVAGQRVWDVEEARKIKRIYDDAGVPSYFGPDLLERVEDYRGSFEHGVEFRVRDRDHQRSMGAVANAYANAPDNGSPEPPPSEYRCPKCNSEEIVFEELERESPDQPDYLSKFKWRCDACGHQWTDDGVEKEA